MNPILATFAAAALVSGAAVACAARAPAEESSAFRQGPGLFAIAAQAEAIVIAEIVRVGADAFDARIVERLHGDAVEETISVQKSDFLPTEPRWAPYAAGQRLVLFLSKSADDGRWRNVGKSGEGELPVDAAYVYLTGHFVEGLSVERFQTIGAEIASQRVTRAEFVDAIEGLDDCFTLDDEPPTQRCDDETLQAYAARSPLHLYLARGAGALSRPRD